MGLFNFAKNIGDKIFHRNDKEETENSSSDNAPVEQEPSAQEIANMLLQRIKDQNVEISDLKVSYNGDVDTAEISGTAKTQADREKAILAVGNVQHVAIVNDSIDIEEPAPESTMYTVKSGDTLSAIAKAHYGNADYMKIFEANKPLLSDPNKIYPGQVLRIPE